MRTLLFPVLALAFLASCDGNTRRTVTVRNETEAPISIHAVASWDSVYTVAPFGYVEIEDRSTLGGQSNPGPISGLVYDLVIWQDQDTSTTAWLNDEEWDVNTNHMSRFPASYHHIFHLEVWPEDF